MVKVLLLIIIIFEKKRGIFAVSVICKFSFLGVLPSFQWKRTILGPVVIILNMNNSETKTLFSSIMILHNHN